MAGSRGHDGGLGGGMGGGERELLFLSDLGVGASLSACDFQQTEKT